MLYTIEHAKSIANDSNIVLTTDDEKASELAFKEGIQIIDRPKILASDKATSIDVIRHALNELADKNYDVVMLLQPTVPIREHKTLKAALELMENTDCDSVSSHYKLDTCHPNRLKIVKGNQLFPYDAQEIENIPRSQLPSVYCRDGSIYAFRAPLPFESNSIMGKDQRVVISNEKYLVNIDTYKDWLLAEALVNEYKASIIYE